MNTMEMERDCDFEIEVEAKGNKHIQPDGKKEAGKKEFQQKGDAEVAKKVQYQVDKPLPSQEAAEEKTQANVNKLLLKKSIDAESIIALALFLGFFIILSNQMGLVNLINTMLATAYDLLMNTVFYIMAISVVAGAVSNILTEFGIIAMANKLLAPLMKPLYGLPGAGIISIFTTYLSDNPAILTLADDKRFRRYFKKYQLPALTNLGTSFGMGLIVTVFMLNIKFPNGQSPMMAVLIGNLCAIIGSIVSVQIMLLSTKKIFGTQQECVEEAGDETYDILNYREIRQGNVAERFLNAILEGGKSGVDVGLTIIPGVLIICNIVMILTNSMPAGGYTGAAYEGVGFITWLGDQLSFVLSPLFGFYSSSGISIPLTALGSAGAAIGIVPDLVKSNLVSVKDISVFTAMCMCWSGYLSTHVAMMDSLKFRELTGKAIFAHTIGGIIAGISANLIYQLISML